MGSTRDPLPLGNWRVTSIAYNPPFHFPPELFWDVADEEDEQRIPPGPNGPVGVVWIDLSKENYLIHGTCAPDTIQRAPSHVFVRLTNLYSARVTLMSCAGLPVTFHSCPVSISVRPSSPPLSSSPSFPPLSSSSPSSFFPF